MKFTPTFLDEIRARLPVSQIVSRHVKLKRQGREFIGLSPFKQEKTPSFTVNDQKCFYHCFSTGEHGDIFKFVMQMEGLSFPEAVERLADEAGVAMPETTPQMRRQEREQDRLGALMETSCRFFQQALDGSAGAQARSYLDGRGLSAQTIEKFRLGFGPSHRSALKEHLAAAGFSAAEMALSGMVVAGDDIPVPYDRFRNRIMFPITNTRGRVIAFGARALDPGQRAKYLNSPETPLFHKGSVLYNIDHARKAAHDEAAIIVVEGYMDVIGLAQAGIHHAVAPLGTALTVNQLSLLWRLAAEPVLCFDGDSAGTRAAFRAMEISLPLLRPGYSLRFAFLPEGCDPDDLVRRQGRAPMDQLLSAARPLSDVLWSNQIAGGEWNTPERRAALESSIEKQIAQISDEKVRVHYQRDMKDRIYRFWRENGPYNVHRRAAAPGARPWKAGRAGPGRSGFGLLKGNFDFADRRPVSDSLKNSALVRGARIDLPGREALILQTMLNHTWLLEEYPEEIAAIPFESRVCDELRNAILEAQLEKFAENAIDSGLLRSHLRENGFEDIVFGVDRAITHKSHKFAEPSAPRGDVEEGWRQMLTLHRKVLELEEELNAAEQAYRADGSEDNFERHRKIFQALQSVDGVQARDEQQNSKDDKFLSEFL